MLDQLIATGVEERSDLARLDDDGGKQTARAPATGPAPDLTQRAGAYAFKVPMIPGAREPGMLTTFGVHAVVFSGAGIAMDAATTAARQREGGGARRRSASRRCG
jgi:hypothetical protein